VLSPDEGETVWLRKLGIRFMIGGEETRGNFALVEHPIGREPSLRRCALTSERMSTPMCWRERSASR
jgi:hypothetical protein